MSDERDHQDRPQLKRWRWRSLPAALALTAVALLFAACGSGSASGPGVASVGSTTTTTSAGGSAPAGNSGTSAAGALKYAQCMRTHGFPSFPDPNAQGGFSDLPANANPAEPTPQYTAANKACQSDLGGHGLSSAQQQKVQANALKFAQCMRTHGVPNYPDPTFSGGGVESSTSKGSGVDPNSPAFQSAQKTCQAARSGSGS